MKEVKSYDELWPFWLDDACYQVSRGVRYLAEPSEVNEEFWNEKIKPEIDKLMVYHGVLIRWSNGTVQVVKHGWVFDLIDRPWNGWTYDAIMGVLLGYDSGSINDFLEKGCRE